MYIELYSKNPPNIAPIKFEYKAIETVLVILISEEKANPEKKIGSVIKKVRATLPCKDIVEKLPRELTNQPANKDANKSK